MNPPTEAKPSSEESLVCGYSAGVEILPLLIFGLPTVCVGIYICLSHASIPFRVGGNDFGGGKVYSSTPVWFGLLFLLPGLALNLFAFYIFMAAKNETISISGNEIIWTGYNGKIKLRSSFEDVLCGSFSTVAGGRGQVVAYEVLARQGRLRWSTQIDNCSRLVSLFQELSTRADPHPETVQDAPVQEDFRCTYPKSPAIGSIALGLILVCAAFGMAFTGLSGQIYAIPEALLGCTILWRGVAGLASAKNETISLHQGRVIWIGPSGKMLFDCAASEIQRNSFEVVNFKSGAVKSYRLSTAKGDLKWKPRLNNIQMLNEFALKLAGPPQSKTAP